MSKQIDKVMALADAFALKTDAYQNGEVSREELFAARRAVKDKLHELLDGVSAPPAAATEQVDEVPESVIDAVAAALGEAYDCTRVWSAWYVNTMGPDDFALVAEDGERVAEISRAAINAYNAQRAAKEGAT